MALTPPADDLEPRGLRGAAVEVLPWSSFLPSLDWRQGEHVSLIGSTGGGKTTLAMGILPFRRAVVLWSAKARDDTIDPFIIKGRRQAPTKARPYREVKAWPPPPGVEKVVLRPRPRSLDEAKAVRYSVFHECASQVMHPKGGNWCVFADDTYYLCEVLKMQDDLTEMWTMGRSHGVSLVAAVQRPAYVPLLAYNQPKHFFFFRENDENNLKRLGEISGSTDVALVKRIVLNLREHQVLYVSAVTGRMVVTQASRR